MGLALSAVPTEPVFVLTSDVDWASEDCLAHLLAIAERAEIVPTVFATHASAVLDAGLQEGRLEIGLHPNFLPGSTHGDSPAAVIDHLRALYPRARGVRNHAYVDSSRLAIAVAAAGFDYDSTLCLQGQPGLQPLHHWTGLIRYPVFWEDDVHWLRGESWDFGAYEESFFSAGLKILNIHPFNLALNVPDQAWYDRHKERAATLKTADLDALAFAGSGTASFLAALLDAVKRRGYRFRTLSDVHDSYAMKENLS